MVRFPIEDLSWYSKCFGISLTINAYLIKDINEAQITCEFLGGQVKIFFSIKVRVRLSEKFFWQLMGESLTPCQETMTFLGTYNLITLFSNFFFPYCGTERNSLGQWTLKSNLKLKKKIYDIEEGLLFILKIIFPSLHWFIPQSSHHVSHSSPNRHSWALPGTQVLFQALRVPRQIPVYLQSTGKEGLTRIRNWLEPTNECSAANSSSAEKGSTFQMGLKTWKDFVKDTRHSFSTVTDYRSLQSRMIIEEVWRRESKNKGLG